MYAVSQVAEITGVSEEDILLIVGNKSNFKQADIDTIRNVISVKNTEAFSTIRETLDYIQGLGKANSEKADPNVFEDSSGPNSGLALLSNAIGQTIGGYIEQANELIQTQSEVIDKFTDQVALHLHHRASLIPSEALQKYIILNKEHPPTRFENQALTKEEVLNSIWDANFRSALPELPKASNKLSPYTQPTALLPGNKSSSKCA